MKFTTIALFVALFALFSFVDALPMTLVSRDVYVPPITAPKAGDVWPIGSTQTVTWDNSNPPKQITNPIGQIYLRQGDFTIMNSECDVDEHKCKTNQWRQGTGLLAENFDITQGSINVTVPNVAPSDDYQIVCKCWLCSLSLLCCSSSLSVRRLG